MWAHCNTRTFFFMSLAVSVYVTVLLILYSSWNHTAQVRSEPKSSSPTARTANASSSHRQMVRSSKSDLYQKRAALASSLHGQDLRNRSSLSVPDRPSRRKERKRKPRKPAPTQYLYLPGCDACGLGCDNCGLGTVMFQYASAYGAARDNGMKLLLSPSFRLLKIFTHLKFNRTITEQTMNTTGWKVFQEKSARVYDPMIESLHQERKNWTLGGSRLQSWKYFQNHEKDIRKQFSFSDVVKVKAEMFLRNAVNHGRIFASDPSYPRVFVGVHVRRSGLTKGYDKLLGHRVAGDWYLSQAMAYFRYKYENVTFIVCSDDMEWCKDHITPDPENPDVVFSEGHSAVEDLAILGACNHTVMTLGAYGWWGAWLANGDVIHYRDWYIKGSNVDAHLKEDDYWQPEWKSMV